MIIAEAEVRMFSIIASSNMLHLPPHIVIESVAATEEAKSNAIWLPPIMESVPKHFITNASETMSTINGITAIHKGVCFLYLDKKLVNFIQLAFYGAKI
jgi:hypothetical protein